MKKCNKCNKRKKSNKFYKSKTTKDRLDSWCKDCWKIHHKKYNAKNKDKIKKYNKEYHKNNKIAINERNKKWYQKNKRRFATYLRNKTKTDINFRIAHNLRSRLGLAMKKLKKSKSTIKLTGYSISELKLYLEKKFKKGMNWKNYGKYWEIDHIKQCCTFDLSKPSKQKKCFHYTNLRPLTIHENRSRPKPRGLKK